MEWNARLFDMISHSKNSPETSCAGSTPENGMVIRRVLVVDDHPLFCDALVMTVQSIVPTVETVLRADGLEQAIDILKSAKPDVVLLDLNLPDVEGLSGLVRLRQSYPELPIVIVSSMADNRMIRNCMHHGARGFIPKHADRSTFETAFRALQSDSRFVPDTYVEPDANCIGSDVSERLESLTNQQSRILQLICEGKLNKQIAFDLSIAETTVKAHVTAIMRKLGVQSRTQAVLIAQEASFSKMLQGEAFWG
jgi:DNA-binding NarL/FixJ family response regulator